MAKARERTGLSDFGLDGWQQGLDRLVGALETDVGDVQVGARVAQRGLETIGKEWLSGAAIAGEDPFGEGARIAASLGRVSLSRSCAASTTDEASGNNP